MSRRVKIVDLLGEPLEIELPGGRVVPVQNLGVDDMMKLLQLEASTVDADGKHEETEMLGKSRDFIVEVVLRHDPDAFPRDEQGEVVKPNWTPPVVLAILSALSGDDSVAAAVTEGLFGSPEEMKARRDELAARRADAETRGETVDEEEAAADPLDSTKPSPTPSSTSDGPSTGLPSGGSSPAAPGEPSSDISDTFAAAI